MLRAPRSAQRNRFLIAALLLAGYGAAARIRFPEFRDLALIFLTESVGVTLYHLALNRAELTITGGAASMLGNTVPVFTCLLGRLFLNELDGKD